MPNDRISDPPSLSVLEHSDGVHQFVSGAGHRRSVPAFMGRSAATRAVMMKVQQAVHANVPVLLVGAPGTGKRTIAEIIHHHAGGETALKTVEIDESGRLDHFGEFAYLCPVERLALDQQARIPNEVGLARLIIGTHIDPDSPEGNARLSSQLVRWCPIQIQLPTLAQRIEDVEGLVLRVIQEQPTTRPLCGIADEALDCLHGYHWPGNVSELEDVITGALVRGKGTQIELRDLPLKLRLREVKSGESPPDRDFALALAERRAIERAMRHARGNKRGAARLLQVGKTTLYRKLRQYESANEGD